MRAAESIGAAHLKSPPILPESGTDKPPSAEGSSLRKRVDSSVHGAVSKTLDDVTDEAVTRMTQAQLVQLVNSRGVTIKELTEQLDGAVNAHEETAAALARAKEQLTDASAAMVEVAADDLEKKATLEAAAAEESESEEEEDERIAKVRGYVTKHDAKETAEYLVSDKLGCESKELGVHFLVEALFDEDEPLVPQIKAKKAYMIAACGQDAKLQTALVCAVELFITESATEQFKQYVAILKELYDEDVLDEEIILKWGADPKSAAKFGVELETSQAVRKQVKPFLEWLAQDDSDSD